MMIPNVIVYAEHSLLELGESKESAEKGCINKSSNKLLLSLQTYAGVSTDIDTIL